MTYQELVDKLALALGYSVELDTDNDGQLIFYTGLYEVQNETELSDMPPANE